MSTARILRSLSTTAPRRCMYRRRLPCMSRTLLATIATASNAAPSTDARAATKPSYAESRPSSSSASLSSLSLSSSSSSSSPPAHHYTAISITTTPSASSSPASTATSTISTPQSPRSRLRETTRCHILRIPSQSEIDELELDAELLSPSEAQLFLTDSAAQQLRRVSSRTSNPDTALRITVESGGCHGYQYKFKLVRSAAERQPDDYAFAHPSLRPTTVLIDAVSLPLMNGSTLDYAQELIGSTFRISDNPHAKGSGCGCGVSWELKL